MRIVVLIFCFVLVSTSTTWRVRSQESKSTLPGVPNEVAITPNSNTAATSDEYLIRAGDTLDVIVERRPELNWRGQVSNEGTISALPYVKKAIVVVCRTELGVASEIAEAYVELIKNPTITVRVVERSREPVILLGAVRVPQRFQVQRDVFLLELLFIAGGVTDRASGDIQIFTPVPSTCSQTQPKNEEVANDAKSSLRLIKIMDLMAGVPDSNPIIRASDIVTVLEAEPVYVTGGVVSPQGINFRAQLTLARAIAIVGGLTKNARASEIRIFRRRGSAIGEDVIKADYNAIRKKKQPDIPLQAYDIIDIPQSSSRRDRRDWQLAAQEIETEASQFSSLPVRVLN
jgi:polysaccharide biosynthesis/export protein